MKTARLEDGAGVSALRLHKQGVERKRLRYLRPIMGEEERLELRPAIAHSLRMPARCNNRRTPAVRLADAERAALVEDHAFRRRLLPFTLDFSSPRRMILPRA